MKTTKRIMAIVLAALMLAMMIPFAASAATEQVTFKVDNDKNDYEFTVYQLATLDVETGTYTKSANTADSIFNIIKSSTGTTAAILAEADSLAEAALAAGTPDAAQIGTANPEKFTKGEKTYTVDSGIYYIRATKQPATVKSVQNSIVALPYYTDGQTKVTTLPDNGDKISANTIHLAKKVKEGDVEVTKEITNSKFAGVKTYTTAQLGETVNFKLTASVVGSTDKKLKAYKINDEMTAGLTYGSVTSVKLTGGAAADRTLTSSEYEAKKISNQKFEVILDKTNVLDKDFFYGYTTVEVECTATVNSSAVYAPSSNNNTDSLTYTNANGVETDVDGDTVKVYTFKLRVKKVDADTKAGLEDAEFKVFSSEADAADDSKAIDTATSDENGNVTFGTYKFDANKKYYVKETKAPAGYNLNSHVYEITTPAATFSATGTLTAPTDGVLVYATAIENTKSRLPETGGAGNWMFTIIGGSLVLIAGALFVVIMKKRSSK